jgi:hypothetical protein
MMEEELEEGLRRGHTITVTLGPLLARSFSLSDLRHPHGADLSSTRSEALFRASTTAVCDRACLYGRA